MTEQLADSEEDPESQVVIAEKEPAPTDAEIRRQASGLALQRDEASLGQFRANLKLRKRVANGALAVMIVQIGLADVGFYLYGHGNKWHIPPEAIDGWLASTVIQVVAVVLVIVKYLFPSGGAPE